MTEENNGSPVAEPEIPATEATAQENPEVAAPENDEAAERDDPNRVVKRMERRIDRLTAARYQAEARAEQVAAQYEQLRAQLSQEAPQQGGQQDPVALAREMSQVERITEKANGIAADGNKRFEGFGKAVQTVSAEVGSLFDKRGKATPIGEAILAADDPAALIHHIGSNPDLAADLADMTPIQQARKLARIEIEMGKPKETKQSMAPKPISPARAIARDTGALSNDLPMDEWARRFLQQRAKR
jgi:hypothetical protein